MNQVWGELLQRSNLTVLSLLLLVAMSAVAVAYAAHLNRHLHNDLQAERNKQNQAQVEWGQLLLEHSTLTTPSRVEKLARTKLGMRVKTPSDIIMVAP